MTKGCSIKNLISPKPSPHPLLRSKFPHQQFVVEATALFNTFLMQIRLKFDEHHKPVSPPLFNNLLSEKKGSQSFVVDFLVKTFSIENYAKYIQVPTPLNAGVCVHILTEAS